MPTFYSGKRNPDNLDCTKPFLGGRFGYFLFFSFSGRGKGGGPRRLEVGGIGFLLRSPGGGGFREAQESLGPFGPEVSPECPRECPRKRGVSEGVSDGGVCGALRAPKTPRRTLPRTPPVFGDTLGDTPETLRARRARETPLPGRRVLLKFW